MTRLLSAFSIDGGQRVACGFRRGTCVTELAMVAPIIVFFMALSYGLWRLSAVENQAFATAHNATAEKSVRFLSLEEIEAPPDFVDASRSPEAAAIPVLPGVSESTLRAFELLPNSAAHAGGAVYFEPITGISEDFGGFNIARDGMVVRPSWVFNGFPYVNSQHPTERDEVRDWYYEAQDATLPREMRERLGLSE